LKDAELRQFCKEAIEALEFWLRRLIDMALTPTYGADYINAVDQTNKNIIKKSIRDNVQNRAASDPLRYPRVVDAMLLDDEIDIVCHPDLYKKHFAEYFSASYPLGNDNLRQYLQRILEPRNNLYHANPISVRQAEQVICYTHDVIDSIKIRMKEKNMHKDYNAPTFIKFSDSTGIVCHDAQIRRNSTGRGGIDLTEREEAFLKSGETFSVEVEVDPSFPSEDYSLAWVLPDNVDATINNSKIVIKLSDKNVGANFTIYCLVTSNEAWHRCGDVDDALGITYKVLPKI
jgi:hypothetical protein